MSVCTCMLIKHRFPFAKKKMKEKKKSWIMLHTLQSSSSPRRKNLGKPWKSGMSNMESSSSFKPCIAGSVPYLERNAFRVSSRGNILLKVEFGRGKQNPSKCFVLLVLIYTNSTRHTTALSFHHAAGFQL